MEDTPKAHAFAPLTRDRCIQMLNNYANGTYQAISGEVCAAAAKFLQNSTPNEEVRLQLSEANTGDGN